MPIMCKEINGKIVQTGTFQKGQEVHEVGGGELYPPDDIDTQILSGDFVVDKFEFDTKGKPIGINRLTH